MKTIIKKSTDTYPVMDSFIRGMGSITLFPQLPDFEPETSPWQGVLDAFAAANRNLTEALNEFKQTEKYTHQIHS